MLKIWQIFKAVASFYLFFALDREGERDHLAKWKVLDFVNITDKLNMIKVIDTGRKSLKGNLKMESSATR